MYIYILFLFFPYTALFFNFLTKFVLLDDTSRVTLANEIIDWNHIHTYFYRSLIIVLREIIHPEAGEVRLIIDYLLDILFTRYFKGRAIVYFSQGDLRLLFKEPPMITLKQVVVFLLITSGKLCIFPPELIRSRCRSCSRYHAVRSRTAWLDESAKRVHYFSVSWMCVSIDVSCTYVCMGCTTFIGVSLQ